jgi:hypothetical protein
LWTMVIHLRCKLSEPRGGDSRERRNSMAAKKATKKLKKSKKLPATKTLQRFSPIGKI